MSGALRQSSAWPAVSAAFEMVNAWDVLQLTDRPLRAPAEKRLREALDAIDALGDFGGPLPPDVLRASRLLLRRWLLSGVEAREGKLLHACAGALSCVQAYISGTIEATIDRRRLAVMS